MKTSLKLTFIALFILSLNCIGRENKAQAKNIYWENLTENQKIAVLALKDISQNAIALYKEEFILRDNEQSIRLLDTLTNIVGNKSSFYFYLFNKVCRDSDGALGEILGNYCQKVILNSPDYVLNYLSKDELLLQKYSEYLGYEMYFKENGTSAIEYNFTEFKKRLSEKINDKSNLEKTISNLYKYIEEMMENME